MSFSENCRRCSVKVDNGTGVLVLPNTEEYSYILTAKHNLYHDYENKKCTEPKLLDSIKLIAYDESIKLSLLKIYELDECNIDIAILKIEKVDIYSPKIFSNNIKIGDEVFLYGYPENRRKDKYTKEEQTPNLKLEVLDIHKNDNHVIVKNDEYRIKKEIDGYSGAGVFKNINDEPHLVGIEFRMDFNNKNKEENNTRLRFFSIKAFDEIVDKYSNELIYLDEDKRLKQKYKIDKEVIEIIKDGQKNDEITIETVSLKVIDRIINVSIYPITYYQYDLFCKDRRNGKKVNNYIADIKRRKVLPVVNVTWKDAMEFCNWLNSYSTKKNIEFSLPSSAEWECIARENMSTKNIWCNQDMTHDIGTNLGTKGIYDILGNIEEFCKDEIRKGASFSSDLTNVYNIKNKKKITNFPKDDIGFRVVSYNTILKD